MRRKTETSPNRERCADCSRAILPGREHVVIERGPVRKRLCSLCAMAPEYREFDDGSRVRG